MKIYDISQEVIGCEVYPGDPAPTAEKLLTIADGSMYNMTVFTMCAHNGTHVDAPNHFYDNGITIDQMNLEVFIGRSYVVTHTGEITSDDAIEMLEKARKADSGAAKRILIKGKAVVSSEAAEVFVEAKILLIGNESQTIGSEVSSVDVHLKLLGAGISILEGIRLEDVQDGVYFLNAAPLKLGGSDGAPCRAILIDEMEVWK